MGEVVQFPRSSAPRADDEAEALEKLEACAAKMTSGDTSDVLLGAI